MENVEITNEKQETSKQVVLLNYAGSGVKSCNTLSKVFIFLAVLSGVITLGYLFEYIDADWCSSEREALINCGISLISTINSIVFAVFFNALGSIAKTALYKRSILEQRFEFLKIEDVNNNDDIDEQIG